MNRQQMSTRSGRLVKPTSKMAELMLMKQIEEDIVKTQLEITATENELIKMTGIHANRSNTVNKSEHYETTPLTENAAIGYQPMHQSTPISAALASLNVMPQVSTLTPVTFSTTKSLAATPNLIPQASTSNLIPQASTSNWVPPAATSNLIPQASTSNWVPPAATSNLIPQASTSNWVPPAATSNLIPQASTSNWVPPAATSNLIQPAATSNFISPSANPSSNTNAVFEPPAKLHAHHATTAVVPNTLRLSNCRATCRNATCHHCEPPSSSHSSRPPLICVVK